MLVSEATCSAQAFACLDLMCVTFESGDAAGHAEEDAVLLEVSERGGLLQTDAGASSGSRLTLEYRGVRLMGRVDSCRQDEYGYLLEFSVEDPGTWFPIAYQPPYLRPKPAQD